MLATMPIAYPVDDDLSVITFKGGRVEQTNFGDCRVLRSNEVPRLPWARDQAKAVA